MINHFRTLLMNTTAPVGFGPLEEYVTPAFTPVALPAGLVTVRALLFGAQPDRFMFACRARQLLMVVDLTPLREFTLTFDPRRTDLTTNPVLSRTTFTPVITGTAPVPVLDGVPASPDGSGRTAYAYNASTTGGVLTLTLATPPYTGRTTSLVYTNSWSQGVPLPGTGYTARFPAGDGSWILNGLLRPSASMGALAAALDSGGGPALDTLFAGASEPMTTFRLLWQREPSLPLRLGAAVCALVWQTEALRGAG